MKISYLLKFLLGSWLRFGVTDDDNGGGDGDNGEAVGTRNDERLSMFDEIADSAEQTRSDEFDVDNIDPDGDADTAATAAGADESTTTSLPKIKVNGQEMEVTPELIEKAQKIAAADEYLKEAARLKREAEHHQNTQRPSEKDVAANVDEDDVALARALQMGSEEEAVKAIQAIKSRTPSLNKDEIVAAARDAMAMDDAVQWFQTEYKFIWEDPMLTKLALARDHELLQTENLTYRQRYDKIGKELGEWSGKLKGGFQQKEEKKEAASQNVVPMANRRAAPAKEEEQEESTQDVIAAMAKRRGQTI